MRAIDVLVENMCNLDALFWPLGKGKMNSVNITSSLNDVMSTLWQKKVKALSR